MWRGVAVALAWHAPDSRYWPEHQRHRCSLLARAAEQPSSTSSRAISRGSRRRQGDTLQRGEPPVIDWLAPADQKHRRACAGVLHVHHAPPSHQACPPRRPSGCRCRCIARIRPTMQRRSRNCGTQREWIERCAALAPARCGCGMARTWAPAETSLPVASRFPSCSSA